MVVPSSLDFYAAVEDPQGVLGPPVDMRPTKDVRAEIGGRRGAGARWRSATQDMSITIKGRVRAELVRWKASTRSSGPSPERA